MQGPSESCKAKLQKQLLGLSAAGQLYTGSYPACVMELSPCLITVALELCVKTRVWAVCGAVGSWGTEPWLGTADVYHGQGRRGEGRFSPPCFSSSDSSAQCIAPGSLRFRWMGMWGSE